MERENRITKLITTLDRATIAGYVKWKAEQPARSLVHGTDDIVPMFFQAEYKGRLFAVYERRTREYDGERDLFYWTSNNYFAILDAVGNVVFETAHSMALHSLRNTISAQVADVDKLLEDLLENTDDDPFAL